MLVVKYSKTGDARFIPHMDTLRHLQRTLRRAAIPIEYSEGFNPHMLLYMSPPVPLGTSGEAEYFAAATSVSPDVFCTEFNRCSVAGIKAVGASVLPKNPNLAAISAAADYEIHIEGIERFAEQIKALITPDFCVTYITPKGTTLKKAGDKIFALAVEKNLIRTRLACGQENLRADRLAETLCASVGCLAQEVDIIKKKVYTNIAGKLTPLDLILNIQKF